MRARFRKKNLEKQICSVRGLCIATGQYSSLCVSGVVLFLGGFDHMEVDEQDREQVGSERESRGARERERGRRQNKETINARTRETMGDMQMD